MTIFVTGTGTGVGKTIVAAALARGLAPDPVRYWKPVQTGPDDDAAVVARAAPHAHILASAFRYDEPLSPDQAAAAANAPPPTVAALSAAALVGDPTIVEGAGGILVPLNPSGETWADLVSELAWPVLVVASPALGTLNHTSLTLRCLLDQGADVLGVVLSGTPNPANEASLRRLFPGVPVHAHDADHKALAAFVRERQAALAASRIPDPWLRQAREHVWFPYTQHQTAEGPLPVTHAKGVWLTTAGGERLLDGTSAWWVNTIGHGRPEIARAIARQQRRLDHVLFAGAVHEGAARLAAEVTALAGSGLTRAFFSDNGSTAVEIALKMAYQGFVNRGAPERTRFLSFRGSYHGDTFGAMSIGAGGFHTPFAPLLFQTLVADPVTEHPSGVCPEGGAALKPRLADLAQLVETHHKTLAGIVLEPLLQGAGGMLVQPAAFVQGVAALAKRYGLPLILDEVFTGLGRVGAPFAFQRAGVEPDLVALAKGLTGGNLPLALTLAREDWFESFLDADKAKALLHGHSFTANPIACAAARAALAISAREDLPGRARALERAFHDWLSTDGMALGVRSGRALGGVLAFELPGTGGADYFHPLSARLPKAARRHGLFLRPLGNTVYLAPPLILGGTDLALALSALTAAVKDVLR